MRTAYCLRLSLCGVVLVACSYVLHALSQHVWCYADILYPSVCVCVDIVGQGEAKDEHRAQLELMVAEMAIKLSASQNIQEGLKEELQLALRETIALDRLDSQSGTSAFTSDFQSGTSAFKYVFGMQR